MSQQLIAELLRFSLVKRLVEEHALSIHRLVQAVQRDRMKPETQRQWAERGVRAVNEAFPDDPDDMGRRSQCLRYLDQVQACHTLIEQYKLQFIEAADLLNRTGFYLEKYASYTIAEPLFKRALTIYEQQVGTTHPFTAQTLNNLASLYDEQGRYTEAEPLYQQALTIYEQQVGATHPIVAQSLNNLALLYQHQGR